MSRRRKPPPLVAPRPAAPTCPQCRAPWRGWWEGSHTAGCTLGRDGWDHLSRCGQHGVYTARCVAYLHATGGPRACGEATTERPLGRVEDSNG